MWPKFVLTICLFVFSCGLYSQDSGDFTTDESLPKSYESWSMFLICNDAWIQTENIDELEELYRLFKSFGLAIGQDHIATWFTTSSDTKSPDIERNATFCEQYGLDVSGGPYVVITSYYPDESRANSKKDEWGILDFHGKEDEEVYLILEQWATALRNSKIYKKNPEKGGYWRILKSTFRLVQRALIGISEDVGFEVGAGPIKVSISES